MVECVAPQIPHLAVLRKLCGTGWHESCSPSERRSRSRRCKSARRKQAKGPAVVPGGVDV
eukprot:1216985-Prymnesium_polylepis.1